MCTLRALSPIMGIIRLEKVVRNVALTLAKVINHPTLAWEGIQSASAYLSRVDTEDEIVPWGPGRICAISNMGHCPFIPRARQKGQYNNLN